MATNTHITTYLLGHVVIAEHPLRLIDWPTQSLPPPEGFGLSHARVRSCAPPSPHVTEQGVQSVQLLQPPSTVEQEYQGRVKLVKQYF